jgi:hypothetical protein
VSCPPLALPEQDQVINGTWQNFVRFGTIDDGEENEGLRVWGG